MAMSENYDVVVLGSGIAGLATGLAAAQRGLRALVIEKAAKVGGGTCESYGLLWVGDNHLARAAGYQDTRDDILAYMTFVAGGEESKPHLETFVDRSPEALKFFAACGIPFRLVRGLADHYLGIAPGARAEGRSLEVDLVSGFDLGDWRDRIRVPASQPYYVTAEEQIDWGGINRMSHWDQDLVRERKSRDMRGKGAGLAAQFLKALLARRVPIVTGVKIDRLAVEEGHVHGVMMDDGRRIGATMGVVLATGGYEANPELVNAFEGLPGWRSQYPPTLTGDGLIMAAEIGAAMHLIRTNLQVMLGFETPGLYPGDEIGMQQAGIVELCSPHTLVVNRSGRRFGDESYFQGLVAALRQFDAMTHSHVNLPAFLIFDSRYPKAYSLAGLPAGAPVPDWVVRDESIRGLAGKLGVDADGLAATVDRFNGFAKAGRDEDFRRGELAWKLANEHLPPGRNQSLGTLAEPPFYGVRLHPIGGVSGGVLTNEHAQVLHQRRHVIPGLYAVGNTAAKIEFGSGYQAGFTLMSGMTFGYVAVDQMLREASRAQPAATRS